jgi:hypothetical protein
MPPPVPGPPGPAAPTAPIIKVAKPEEFNGTVMKLEQFILVCELYLTTQAFTNDVKVLFTLSYIKKGNVEPWAQMKAAALTAAGWHTADWDIFKNELKAAFGDMDEGATARLEIAKLKQGKGTVDEFNVKFSMYEIRSALGDVALIDLYKKALNQAILTKIYSLPTMPANLTEWKTRASQFDRQYCELLSVKSINTTSSIPNTSHSKPAQTTIAMTQSTSGAPVKQEPSPGPSLTSTTHVLKGTCFKCRKLGHWANECPMPDQPGNPPPYQSASGSTIT